MSKFPPHYVLSSLVAQALAGSKPVVALESTVITHGLPRPENLNLARQMEQEVLDGGATPATIAILNGKVHVGLEPDELEHLSKDDNVRKISLRDFGVAIGRGESGGTTVAATMRAAHAVGIQVFATGGIGGVHRGNPFDISADLQELSRTPVAVVCAGAKAILDLPATVEYLETMGVPVIGYQTEQFPAFYSVSSGLPVVVRANNPAEVARIACAQWETGFSTGILVTVPPPDDVALPAEEIEQVIQKALKEAEAQHISGYRTTPFLLAKVSEMSGGASMKANLALLKQNARIAAKVAVEMAGRPGLLSV